MGNLVKLTIIGEFVGSSFTARSVTSEDIDGPAAQSGPVANASSAADASQSEGTGVGFVDQLAHGFMGEATPDFDLVSKIKAGWVAGNEAIDVAKGLNDKANANVFAVSYRQADGQYTLYQVNGQGVGGMSTGDMHVWSDPRTFTPQADTVDRTERPNPETIARGGGQ